MAHKKSEAQIDFRNRFGAPSQWVAAAAVGATSGYVTFRNLVLDKFHDFMMTTGHIKDRYLQYKGADGLQKLPKSLERIHVEHRAKIRYETAGTDKFKEMTRTFRELISSEKTALRNFENHIANIEQGVEIHGFKGATTGLFQRMALVSKESRWNIGFKSIFAIGAGTAATLMAFNQLNNRDKLNELDKSTGDTGRKLDAIINEQSEAKGRSIEVKGLLTQKQPSQTKSDALAAERREHTASQAQR